LKKTYPYSLNIIIATISVVISISYIAITVPPFIENLKCFTCGDISKAYFIHYWYRWSMYLLLVFAGVRLYLRLIGARRLYYLFFTCASITAILDIISGFHDMTAYDITMDVVTPITISILGVIYFKNIYKATLKYR